jgi:hypothetical protein
MNFSFSTEQAHSQQDLDAVFQFTVPSCFEATNFCGLNKEESQHSTICFCGIFITISEWTGLAVPEFSTFYCFSLLNYSAHCRTSVGPCGGEAPFLKNVLIPLSVFLDVIGGHGGTPSPSE